MFCLWILACKSYMATQESWLQVTYWTGEDPLGSLLQCFVVVPISKALFAPTISWNVHCCCIHCPTDYRQWLQVPFMAVPIYNCTQFRNSLRKISISKINRHTHKDCSLPTTFMMLQFILPFYARYNQGWMIVSPYGQIQGGGFSRCISNNYTTITWVGINVKCF